MKKIITFISALLHTYFSNAQAPDSWTEKKGVGLNAPASSFMVQRQAATTFTLNSKIYIGTGYSNLGSGAMNDFWEYDPITNLFTQKANVPGSGRAGAVGFSIGNKGYIGIGTPAPNDFWEYDPATNLWQQKANFIGIAQVYATGFSIGDKGYVGAGLGFAGSTREFWEYNPTTNLWTQKTPVGNLPVNGINMACGFSIGNKGYIGSGIDDGGNQTSTFYEYNPQTDNWTVKAFFAGGARYGAVGFSLGSKGYIGTGLSSSGLKNDFWEYDTTSNAWSQKTNFGGSARWLASGISVNNKGYIFTGKDVNYKNDIWEYTLVTNDWTLKMNTAETGRHSAAGFSIGSKGYIGTGTDAYNIPKNDFWQFDASINAWTQKANIGGAERYGASGFSIGNKGYIAAGSSNGQNTSHLWEYDPANNIWTQKTNFGGGGRIRAVAFSIGGKGYIGTGGLSTGGGYKNDFWEYNPVTNTWTQKASFGGSARSSAAGFSIGNKGYIGTGNDGTAKNDFWEYNPDLNLWTQKANFGGTARYNAVGFSIGGKGYVGTGYGNTSNQNDIWEYNPVTDSWTQKNNFGGSKRSAAISFNIGETGYIGTGYGNLSPGIYFNDFWEYSPVCTTPVSTIYSSGNISFCTGDSVFLYTNNGYNYQWKKNGVDITGATSYFYYAKTTGNYTCYLSNTCGAVTSSAISVTVNSLPSATITSAGPTTFCSGGSVVLNAPVTSNRSYQWKKGANLISGATLSSYTATTGGNYKVIVTNTVTGCSKTTGSAVVVTVNAKPAATITPQGPTTFCAGGSVVLAANTGAGLTYKWKKGSNFIAGATLVNYTATTAGTYRVEITNSNSCTKLSAGVTVTVPCKLDGSENENAFDINIFPNPNSGEFTVEFSKKLTSPVQIELTDEMGKVVKTFETIDETIVIKESKLAKGIYCLSVRNNDEVVIKKIGIAQ